MPGMSDFHPARPVLTSAQFSAWTAHGRSVPQGFQPRQEGALADHLPPKFAFLVASKTVSAAGYPSSKWSAVTCTIEPQVSAADHLTYAGRPRGHTLFTDGTSFTDGGVGAGNGPDRYSAGPREDESYLQDVVGLKKHQNGYWRDAPSKPAPQ